MEGYDYLVKVLLIGSSGVGKSSLLIRFTQNKFEDETWSTIGVDFRVRFMDLLGHRIKCAIWDTAGQERFRTLTSSYYRGSQGIILVYDVSARESFENLESWLEEAERYCTVPGVVKMLVGNKIDKERVVARHEGEAFACQHSMLYVETSAKTSHGVTAAFEELVAKIVETGCTRAAEETGTVRNLDLRQDSPNRGCGCG